jgi:hypothetical protein
MSTTASLTEIQRKREERKAALQIQREEQYARDLEAVDALEVEHGDSNVAVLEIPFTPGLPVLAAVRTPTDAETKRYRSRLREKNADAAVAAEEVGLSCVVYPKGEALESVLSARPGLRVQLGTEALGLATAKAKADEKS